MKIRNRNNEEVARVLGEIAELLEVQDANLHRVRAYRRGADAIRELDVSLEEIVDDGGTEALRDVPGIGESLSRLILEYLQTGRSRLLDRLRGAVAPEDLFDQIPGIGHELAEKIVKTLDVKTLEELEQAAHDGRLAKVEGFGPNRIKGVQMSLAGLLSGFARRRMEERLPGPKLAPQQPPVALLLDIDEQYRTLAKTGQLRKIAPKRFNPGNVAWLPVLHTEKGGWEFTALFSNTARAHELERIYDWVVVFYEQPGTDGQATVVTETSGPLKGKRVVRGREEECRQHYRSEQPIDVLEH
jgi:putative hydrolase